ncbi:hypothetical protein ACFFX0_27780 [Citricoccus parietis]|uniref:Uncharacterized protein n=1 Tax=Citricoccus parietis TaxID=592307 RepID=A0ABV5G761_9MICC
MRPRAPFPTPAAHRPSTAPAAGACSACHRPSASAARSMRGSTFRNSLGQFAGGISLAAPSRREAS